ncbi:unnamed protein product, partial [Trichogramma brassicae]
MGQNNTFLNHFRRTYVTDLDALLGMFIVHNKKVPKPKFWTPLPPPAPPLP